MLPHQKETRSNLNEIITVLIYQTIYAISELNQNWHITIHKRNQYEINQLVTGFVIII